MVEEVKALPETLVLIMEGGPSCAKWVLEVLKVKTCHGQTVRTQVRLGLVTMLVQNRAWTGSQVLCREGEQEYVVEKSLEKTGMTRD